MDSNKVRLIDVFITGPLQIIISTYITTSPLLRYFMLITGILNIIYNGHNFLLFDSVLKKPLPILNNFVHSEHGKYQLHKISSNSALITGGFMPSLSFIYGICS